MQITVVGLDIAKHVFQAHAADANGRAVAQVKLRRAQVLNYFRGLPPCLVGLEACAISHHWARELIALGHTVRLMPPAYVKAYVKRNKTDAADAEAIAEALTRPTMRFVPVKSVDQQSMLMLHRVRELLVRQRTMLATALRAHLAEFGIIAPQGIHRVEKLAAQVHDPAVPPPARDALKLLVAQLASTWRQIDEIEKKLVALHRTEALRERSASAPVETLAPKLISLDNLGFDQWRSIPDRESETAGSSGPFDWSGSALSLHGSTRMRYRAPRRRWSRSQLAWSHRTRLLFRRTTAPQLEPGEHAANSGGFLRRREVPLTAKRASVEITSISC